MRPRRILCWPIALALMSVSACGTSDDRPSQPTSAPSTSTSTPVPTPTPSAGQTSRPPCDPGFGFPEPTPGCPDESPETGWLIGGPGGEQLTLERFRTLSNDAEGAAYAERHDLEFPFPNDYYDAPLGVRHPMALGPDTVCTGVIVVGYEEPLHDHAVDCTELLTAVEHRRVPVAVWREGSAVVQVSELYRP